MECRTVNKPNQAQEWVILGTETTPLCLSTVHFDLYIAKNLPLTSSSEPTLKSMELQPLMPEVNLAPKGLFYAMI